MTTRKDRKRYSREFKLEAVRLVNESGKPATESGGFLIPPRSEYSSKASKMAGLTP